MVVSGSDDGCIKLWDSRAKDAVETFEDKYQVTSVCFSDAGDMVFSGGLDNQIKVKVVPTESAFSLTNTLGIRSGTCARRQSLIH